MGILAVNVNSNAPAGSTDPRQVAKQLAQELQALLSDPQGNKKEITSLETELRNVITNNPGAFSNIVKTDALNFCDTIEDYYMVPGGDPQALGGAEGWLQNLNLDLAQGMIPLVPPIPSEMAEDMVQMINDMNSTPPNLADLKKCLADFEKLDPKNLPALLAEKVQAVISSVTQFLANPDSSYAKGQAIASVQSAFYALWIEGPHK